MNENLVFDQFPRMEPDKKRLFQAQGSSSPPMFRNSMCFMFIVWLNCANLGWIVQLYYTVNRNMLTSPATIYFGQVSQISNVQSKIVRLILYPHLTIVILTTNPISCIVIPKQIDNRIRTDLMMTFFYIYLGMAIRVDMIIKLS